MTVCRFRSKSGGWTRRRVIGALPGAAATAALPAVSLFPARAQGRAGTLTIAVPSVKPGLDPAFASTLDGYMLTQAIFSNLTTVDETLSTKPQLATSWEASPDGKTWTFRLARGVKFHNGRELQAEDVKFSLDRIMDPKTGSQGRSLLGPITAVRVLDPGTVAIELSRRFSDLPTVLAGPHGRIVARENIDQIASAPIGTGPFRLTEYVQGTRAVLTRFEGYFEPGFPKLEQVRQVYMKENAAQVTALGRGEIDVMMLVPYEIVPLLQKNPDIRVLEVPSSTFQPITMFAGKKPANDARVREALRLAADRKVMLEVATGGHGVLGNDTPVAPISPFYNKTLKQRAYDPKRAKELLAQAGYPNGLDITLYTSNGRPGLEEAAQAYRETAAAAGIRVNIESVEIPRLFSEFGRQPRDNALVHLHWGGRAYGDPMTLYVGSNAGFNYSKYSNPQVDTILADAEGEPDPDKRKRLFDEAQEIFWRDGSEIIPYFANHIAAVRKHVRNYPMHPSQWVDLRQVSVD